MSGTEGFEYWWLIPLILMGLCLFGARSCSAWRGKGSEKWPASKEVASSDSALEILSRRYARGEIEEEEYRRKSETITQARKGEK